MDIRPLKWGEWQDESDPKSRFGRSKRALSIIHSEGTYTIKVGIPWEKEVFVQKALDCQHPLLVSALATASDSLEAMFMILTQGIANTRVKRCEFVSTLSSWAKEAGAEGAVGQECDESVST